MRVEWVFHKCHHIRGRAKSYWARKQARLERLLSTYADDLCGLRFTVYWHEQQEQFEVRAVLSLPTGTLVARSTCGTINGSLDAICDELVRSVKKHRHQLRKDYVYRRRRQDRESLSAAGALLRDDVARNRKHAFFDLLKPFLASLQHHAHREIQLLELEGTLPRRTVTARDVVDDVLTRAWEEFEDRPRKLELDVWLMGLLHKRLQEIIEEHQGEPLSQPLDEPAAREEASESDIDEADYWFEHAFGSPEPLTIEDLLPDFDAEEISNTLSEQEQREQLQQLLAEMPRKQRDVLLLTIAEGLDVEEVAAIEGCTPAEVQQYINAGRSWLAHRLASVMETSD